MTEEEAKTKTCCGHPYVAWAALATLPRAQIADVSTFDKCIASACMAWRSIKQAEWEYLYQQSPAPEKGWEKIPNTSVYGGAQSAAGWRRRVTPAPAPSGYCGLAGAPQ